ncbi:MAG: hypothetical protein K0S04_2648 [Herbinix sp.]|jgi:hypothetical protein|nr:hypothetical protein [Herbinix sp.]
MKSTHFSWRKGEKDIVITSKGNQLLELVPEDLKKQFRHSVQSDGEAELTIAEDEKKLMQKLMK